MSKLILQTEPKARKEYYCMACEILRESGNLRDYTFIAIPEIHNICLKYNYYQD